jgi:predicted transport protein
METSPFDKSPVTRELYDHLLERVKALGPIVEETKNTSAHIVAGKGAFLGVHPRASGLLVNIVLDHTPASARVAKSEQVSKCRFHNEVKISSQEDVDEELMGWIGQAYQLKVNTETNV